MPTASTVRSRFEVLEGKRTIAKQANYAAVSSGSTLSAGRQYIRRVGKTGGARSASTYVQEPSVSFSALIKNLERLGRLDNNWNGYGAPAPTDAATFAARLILEQISTMEIALFPSRLVASAEGGVAVCFFHNGRHADIECLNSGETLCVRKDLSTMVTEIHQIDIHSFELDDCLRAISDFLGN